MRNVKVPGELTLETNDGKPAIVRLLGGRVRPFVTLASCVLPFTAVFAAGLSSPGLAGISALLLFFLLWWLVTDYEDPPEPSLPDGSATGTLKRAESATPPADNQDLWEHQRQRNKRKRKARRKRKLVNKQQKRNRRRGKR